MPVSAVVLPLLFKEVEEEAILDVYMKEIIAILELASPVWHSGLTKAQAAEIERVPNVMTLATIPDKFLDHTVS